jgi:muramoyltetrapeptide carboxypeptidase
VALVAPAGPVAEDRIEVALQRCATLGLEAVLAPAARGRHGAYLAAPDDARLTDLQAAFDDSGVDAVWALRGGYGTMRVIAQLDLSGVAESPKAFIGFSDNTALHLALHARGVVSYHGPNAGSDITDLTEGCLERVLFRAEPAGTLPVPADRPAQVLHGGTAEGPAHRRQPGAAGGHGGDASGAAHARPHPVRGGRGRDGVPAGPGVDAARAERRAGWCGRGGVRPVHRLRRRRALDLLAELTAPLGVPVLADLPFGHEPDNWTLPVGVRARLDTAAGTLSLLEPGVS